MKYTEKQIDFIMEMKVEGFKFKEITREFNSKFKAKKTKKGIERCFERYFEEYDLSDMKTVQEKAREDKALKDRPKILLLDIETAPISGYLWSLWQEGIGLNQMKSDWYVLSWAAKWLGEPKSKIMYMDQRNAKNIEDDKSILRGIWDLLNVADIVISQNGISFDVKKLNARFIINGFPPTSSYKNIDTLRIAKRKFKFTSNKLEYMTDKLCKNYKKLKHGKYPGFELWAAVLRGEITAWKEMEKYNKYDVLSLEELYTKLIPWDNTINFGLYVDEKIQICTCGSKKFKKCGFHYTKVGKYQKHKCLKCGAENRDRVNLFSKEKRKSIRIGLPK